MIRWTREVHHIFDRPIIPSNRIIQLDSHPNSASKLCLATETDRPGTVADENPLTN